MASVGSTPMLFNMAKARARTPGRGPTQKPWRRIYLREWRDHRGLSQEELAEKTGVSTGQISLIESRKSAGSPESLEKLAKALGCEVGELLDVKPEGDGEVFRVWVSKDDLPRIEAVIAALITKK